MIQKLKLLMISFVSLIMFAVPLVASTTVYAAAVTQPDINGGLNCGANGDFTQTNCGTTNSGSNVNSLITTVINVVSIVVGVIAVIMIIVGGLRYVTSAGKQESVTGAKNTIMYALIGLVIVALAQIIVHFVLSKTTGATS